MNRKEAEKIKDELLNAFDAGQKYELATVGDNFIIWFNKTYPPEPEYIPFEYTDFKDFMLKEVRRKGENFKDEIWIVIDKFETACYVYHSGELLLKFYSSLLEEWEFSDGKPFGKLKQ